MKSETYGKENLQDDSEIKDEEIKFKDLEGVVKIYDDFRDYQRKTNPLHDKILEKEFEEKMSELADDLKEALQEKSSSEFKDACILKVRHEILDLTSSKISNIIIDTSLSKLWRNIRTEHNEIVQSLLKIITQITPISENSQGENIEIKRQLKELKEANEKLNKEINKQISEEITLKKSFEMEIQKLREKINGLETKDRKTLNPVPNNTKRPLDISVKEGYARASSGIRSNKKSVFFQYKSIREKHHHEYLQVQLKSVHYH